MQYSSFGVPIPTGVPSDHLSAFYIVKLLVLCGDIEENPGPDMGNKQLDEVFKFLQEGQTKLLTVVNKIESIKEQIKERITNVSNRLQNLEAEANVFETLECEVCTTRPALDEVKK